MKTREVTVPDWILRDCDIIDCHSRIEVIQVIHHHDGPPCPVEYDDKRHCVFHFCDRHHNALYDKALRKKIEHNCKRKGDIGK